MKLLLAFIPPERLQRVTEALVGRHVHGLSVSEARGFGQEHDTAHPQHREFRGLEMTRKIRLEVICHDQEVEPILTAIYEATHTGQRGAGKVFVLPVDDALRLMTGERGADALGPKRENKGGSAGP
jgi:nitrogen regulatory protein P-II 1